MVHNLYIITSHSHIWEKFLCSMSFASWDSCRGTVFLRNQMTKILCYKSKDIHLPSSMYLDPLCVQINNLLHTGYCNILCKYVNMAMFYYAFFHTEDYILFFLLNKFIFIQNNIISWSSHCAKYCCPGNWLNQQSCVADKLEHEEKYDGRNCFVLYNIFKFFLRRSGILSILLFRIGPSV